MGVVICNNNGDLIGAMAKPTPKQLSPLTTELFAIKEGCDIAIDCGFK